MAAIPETKPAVRCGYKKRFNLRCDLRNGPKTGMVLIFGRSRLTPTSGPTRTNFDEAGTRSPFRYCGTRKNKSVSGSEP
jgi:hypothetical protein